jgi:hypothetical protein
VGTRATILAVALALLAALAGTARAAAPVTVALTVDTKSPQGGDQVTLVARARHYLRGDVVVIKVTDADGASTVASCRSAGCSGDWTESDAGSATFQAFVRTKLHGGKLVAHTPVLVVRWAAAPPPPPPPPPPPAARTGHYCGLSNEGKSVCFDVIGDAGELQQVSGLHLESNVVCGDGSGWWWSIYPPVNISIDSPALTFSYTFSGPMPNVTGASNAAATYTIAGTFDTAGNVTGTVHLTHISWDANGKHYDCAGDPRTWTARLGA